MPTTNPTALSEFGDAANAIGVVRGSEMSNRSSPTKQSLRTDDKVSAATSASNDKPLSVHAPPRDRTSSSSRRSTLPVQEEDEAPSVLGSDGNASRTEHLLSVNKDNPLTDPTNLIVNYIPTPVTDEELRKLFEPYGTIDSARVIADKANNHPKGYGFVKFSTEAAATEAIKKMNGYEIGGKRLRVTRANGPKQSGASEKSPSATSSAQTSAAKLSTAAVAPAHVAGVAGQSAPVMLSTAMAAGFQSYPGTAPTFTFLQQPPLPQQVYFSANLVAGGYQLNPQPFTFTAAGNTVIAQPVAIHGQAPIIYLPSQASTIPNASAEVYTTQPAQQQQHHATTSTPGQASMSAVAAESLSTSVTAGAGGNQSAPPSTVGTSSRPLTFTPFSPPSQSYSPGCSYSVFNSTASLEQCQPNANNSGFVVGPGPYTAPTYTGSAQ